MDTQMGPDGLDELDAIGCKEILEQDSRPTFVLDLDPDDLGLDRRTHLIRPLFCNAALRTYDSLLDAVTGECTDATFNHGNTTTHKDFRKWATGVTKFDDSKDVFPLTLFYHGLLWTGSTVRKRWRLISGNQCYQPSNQPSLDLSAGPPGEVAGSDVKAERTQAKPLRRRSLRTSSPGNADVNKQAAQSALFSPRQQSTPQQQNSILVSSGSSNDTGNTASTSSITLIAPENGVPDWTVPNLKGNISGHLELARKIDWASTPLGAMKSWSPEFRQIANLLMANPHPAAIFFGHDLTMLYNEAYRDEVAGNKHPALLGTGFQGPFAELWENVGPVFAECARTGISARMENQYLPMERHGYLEETFFSWSFTPLYGGSRQILGFYNAPFETTQQVINHRRMQTLYKLTEVGAQATTVKGFWRCMLSGLEDNHFDVPFALLYSVAESDDGDESSISSGSTISPKSCVFEGSIAVPNGHPAAPHRLDLKRSREGFIPSFREAMRTREPTKLQTRDGTLPEELLQGIDWRGFGDPCREAIIFPVRPTNGEMVLAFLLLGLNPRRAYDDDYKAWTTMMNRQLATSLASVMLFEEELRQSRDAAEAAAFQQEQLTQQLAVQTSRLRRMTELSPLGMYLISPEGVLTEANDRYYEMTGHPRHEVYEMSFLEHVEDGNRKAVIDGWHQMTVEHRAWTSELQLKKISMDPRSINNEPIDYWVQATSQPEFAPNGTIRSITGSITDISQLKWAQGLQERRLEEAEETRRQQNEFIDITSHEMRNPLSAILQCADDISSSLAGHQFHKTAASVVENCIEAANTIALCVQHQKSIVDDILTVSKLDSNLLLITPVVAQPISVLMRAVKMFECELQAKAIELEFRDSPEFEALRVDWAILDQSRLLQILINLMTNAIKFTQNAPLRKITVAVGVTLSPPFVPNTPNLHYIPPRNQDANTTSGSDWGSGERIYLRFKVQDTGCGLTPEEMQVLFQRFQQASPRTHAQYGGSGLGLFISRQLTELHGGQVGVASEAGMGSTFGFYIKARRSDAPAPISLQATPSNKNHWEQCVAPQRQDLAATSTAEAGLIATKAAVPLEARDLSILVVEDNLVNQKVLMKQLKKAGCSVAVADNGVHALAYLETTEFCRQEGLKLSVILMDLEMPEMDGITCVRTIRRMESEGSILRHVPVIAVTANVRGEQIVAAKGSGMDDVVSKPFRVPDLLTQIHILLTGQG